MKGLSGQRRTQNFPIRLNRAPSVYVNDILTVPGKPVSIEDYRTLDLDGIQSYFLQVIHNGVTIAEWNGSNLEDWKHTFYQRDNSSESKYTLMTSATDIYGLTGSSSSTVIVQNTSSGDLYTDEVWQGEHRITGPVRVLSGTTLTVKDGTNIFAVMGSGKVPRLIIEEGAKLIHEGGANYGIESLYRNDYWDGIEIAGDANLKNIRVSRARRGITLLNNSIKDIDNVGFYGNLIGLHLVGTSPKIKECLFTSNRHYGVKEDFDSRPVLEGNTFQNNFYDYYQNQSGGRLLAGEVIEQLTKIREAQ